MRDAANRGWFLLLSTEGLEQHNHRLHAYCWMGNHVHMLLQCSDTPISEMMWVLSQRYTYWFNRQHDRVGHLFQGRYKALLVDADRYLLELVRYIHLNPVRAQLVQSADDYPWSSHHAYLGRQAAPWLTPDWVLGAAAISRRTWCGSYPISSVSWRNG